MASRIAPTIFLAVLLTFAGLSAPAGATGTLAVSAVVLSKNQCKFNTAATTLIFGTIDPLNSTNVSNSAALTFTCRGSVPIATFLISQDSGLHETAPNGNRMLHASDPAAFLPYSLALSPISGSVARNVAQTLTVTGTIASSDFRHALFGTYSDTVTLSIMP